jgi:soluble lytic murein transglycosylase
MRRFLISFPIIILLIIAASVGGYYFNEYWISRYDGLIERQAGVYNLEPKLIWCLIYEETYFRTSVIGDAQEVGLMQVTPTVAKQWAKETGLKEFEMKTAQNVQELLIEPERNIQIGSWYLEKVKTIYRGFPAEKTLMLAAYNAGPSRVEEWTKNTDISKLSEKQFIELIKISSTKAYVTSILKRFREYPKTLKKIDPEKQKDKFTEK